MSSATISTAIPSTTTLQAFEAVARLRSFALAASEMNLTASAISHQIAKLEEQIGVRLLDRTTAGVRLTEPGAAYLQRVAGALGALRSATRDVQEGVRNSLYVHASPSLASLWLMPRLVDFAQSHPDISLQLSASHIHSDFAAGQSDIDIRYGDPRWPNLVVKPLFAENVMPLVSPSLKRQLRLKSPADVLRSPLIQSTISLVQWRHWLASCGVDEVPDRFTLRFDRAQLALDAAVQGLGVALESTTIAAPHLTAKRLVPLFRTDLYVQVFGHHVVYPERNAKRPEVAQFINWLERQAKKAA